MPSSPLPPPCQRLVWNGLRATVPAAWRPDRLGLRHVCLADDDGPVFECKWRPKAGRAGMEAALRALTPKGRARAGAELPAAWREALADYELMSLTWAREGRSGLGAALFHPETGTAAVFQAYGGPDGPGPERLAEVAAVLAGLTFDLPGPPAFSIYGLSLTAPPGYVLSSFSFAPGRFVLGLAAPRRRLDVVRLAPASVLLARQGPEVWTRQALGFPDQTAVSPDTVAGQPAWWAARAQGRGIPDRVARWLGRKGRLGLLRHDVGADKLLGAVATATAPVDRTWLAGVVAGCVSL